jgi:hypothetical protein
MLHPPPSGENQDVADADVCNMLTADAADDVLAALPAVIRLVGDVG